MKFMSGTRSGASIFIAVLCRPSLWITALTQVSRLTPRRWWARAPFLPVPTREYIRFRVLTQYGERGHELLAADVLSYLRWLKDLR
ncbi:unannotated protein [freshwater metagenome]|jgi:hypothetical protein|uniref:Unannotated protein n=2 Tax=freshwater metagenome TaxID=449393 RepID=A0A6J6XKD0_9ZZZZ|nr:hypothetical protein [Actinomycetota bacterium]